MADDTQASEMLPRIGPGGMLGYFIGGRFIPRMAGGETPPPGNDDDPPPGDDGEKGKDGKPFDADRAQRTIDQLREEVRTGRAAQKELDAAKARLKEIDDASKSETERLASKATDAEQKLAQAEARAQDLALRLTVERAATKAGFHDPDDAYRLIDRRTVEMDDDGEPTNVEKLLADLAKAKPHLVKADDGAGKKADRGTPPTPKPNGKPATRADLVEQARKELAGSGRYTPL